MLIKQSRDLYELLLHDVHALGRQTRDLLSIVSEIACLSYLVHHTCHTNQQWDGSGALSHSELILGSHMHMGFVATGALRPTSTGAFGWR